MTDKARETSPIPDEVETNAQRASGDSPKRQGDKLDAGTGEEGMSSGPVPGDSPKRQGDKLETAVERAAGR